MDITQNGTTIATGIESEAIAGVMAQALADALSTAAVVVHNSFTITYYPSED